jgi:hypothetical protein
MVGSSGRRAKAKGASIVARSRSRIKGAARRKAKGSSIMSDEKVRIQSTAMHQIGG